MWGKKNSKGTIKELKHVSLSTKVNLILVYMKSSNTQRNQCEKKEDHRLMLQFILTNTVRKVQH